MLFVGAAPAMTELKIARRWFSKESTIGELISPPGYLLAFTLEDHCPSPYVKTPGKTCIPPGRYQVVRRPSKRFAPRQMLRLLEVPQFEGVLVHEGNTAADTEGCIIVGKARMLDKVLYSVDALRFVDEAIDQYLAKGDVWVTIAGEPGQPIC